MEDTRIEPRRTMAAWIGACKCAPLALLLVACAAADEATATGPPTQPLAEPPAEPLIEPVGVPPAAELQASRVVAQLPTGARHEVAVSAIGPRRPDLAAPEMAGAPVPYVISRPSPRVDPWGERARAQPEPALPLLVEPAAPAPAPEPAEAFGVQLMAVSAADTAAAALERLRGAIAPLGVVERVVVQPPPEGGRWYRLQAGPLEGREAALAACRALAAVSPDCFPVEGFDARP
jgi:hypothetical protein